METVLITGGTGFVGRHLCLKLKEKGYNVAVLGRTNNQNASTYVWDLKQKTIDEDAIKAADFIIHLAGANIGEKRWTAQRKQLLIDSRVQTTELLLEKVKEHKYNLKAFVSASAIGYYGTITTDKVFQETDAPSADFLGETCRLWESAADGFETLGIRTVKIRTGVVLSEQEGALAKMKIPVQLGVGSAIGRGNQYIPWIHIDDLCNIYIKAIEDTTMKGAYNAVAPDHQTNLEFTRILANILKRPLWFPNIPVVVMKLLFGKMSSILLQGSRISSDKIRQAGYQFLFPDLTGALTHLLKHK